MATQSQNQAAELVYFLTNHDSGPKAAPKFELMTLAEVNQKFEKNYKSAQEAIDDDPEYFFSEEEVKNYKKYSVHLDAPGYSEELQSGFETISEALDFSISKVSEIDSEKQSIQILSEEGVELTMGKSEDGKGYFYCYIDPKTGNEVGDTKFVNC